MTVATSRMFDVLDDCREHMDFVEIGTVDDTSGVDIDELLGALMVASVTRAHSCGNLDNISSVAWTRVIMYFSVGAKEGS